MDIFKFLIVFLWIAWLLYWWTSSIGVKRTIRNNNWWIGIGIRIIIIIIVLLFLKVSILYHFVLGIRSGSFYNNAFIGVIGLFIAILGFALSIWARVYLGKNWGMPMATKEKPELVTTGPYKYVRHPIYTGMIIAMLGTTLTTTIFWLIPFIFLSAYFVYSSKVEEKTMIRQFPKEYPAYKKRTKALIPFLY